MTHHHGAHCLGDTSDIKFKVTVFVPDCLEIKYGPFEPFAQEDEGAAVRECSIPWVIFCHVRENEVGGCRSIYMNRIQCGRGTFVGGSREMGQDWNRGHFVEVRTIDDKTNKSRVIGYNPCDSADESDVIDYKPRLRRGGQMYHTAFIASSHL